MLDVICYCPKFGACSFIRSEVIKGVPWPRLHRLLGIGAVFTRATGILPWYSLMNQGKQPVLPWYLSGAYSDFWSESAINRNNRFQNKLTHTYYVTLWNVGWLDNFVFSKLYIHFIIVYSIRMNYDFFSISVLIQSIWTLPLVPHIQTYAFGHNLSCDGYYLCAIYVPNMNL